MPYEANNNPSQPKNFETLIACMKFLAPRATFRMAETYLDHGANMKWRTILATGPDCGEYQLLTPADWDRLDLTTDLLTITQLAADIFKKQINLLDPQPPVLKEYAIFFTRANGTKGTERVDAPSERIARADFNEIYRHADPGLRIDSVAEVVHLKITSYAMHIE